MAFSSDLEQYFVAVEQKWSSAEGANMLTVDLINEIHQRWSNIPPFRKLRVLVSLVHLKSGLRVEASTSLLKILDRVESEANPWLTKLGRLLRSFIASGSIDVTDVDTETAYKMISALRNMPTVSMDSTIDKPWECSMPPEHTPANVFEELNLIRSRLPYVANTNVDKTVAWAFEYKDQRRSGEG